MPRLLLNRLTNKLSHYPREDDEPVVGLDRTAAYVVEIIREPEPTDCNPATHFLAPLEPVVDIADPDSADVNGTATYGWRLVPIAPPAPASDWAGFLAALMQSVMFSAAQVGAHQILQAELPRAMGVRQERLLRASTALASLPAVLLAAASPGGDPNLFMGAWLILRQAHLVSPEVAAGMAQLATCYHLPPDLIRSLEAPDLSPG